MAPAPKKSIQSQRFIEKARELGCDEDEAAFEKRLKKIAGSKPAVQAATTKMKPGRKAK